jgi:hypothetical protein
MISRDKRHKKIFVLYLTHILVNSEHVNIFNKTEFHRKRTITIPFTGDEKCLDILLYQGEVAELSRIISNTDVSTQNLHKS